MSEEILRTIRSRIPERINARILEKTPEGILERNRGKVPGRSLKISWSNPWNKFIWWPLEVLEEIIKAGIPREINVGIAGEISKVEIVEEIPVEILGGSLQNIAGEMLKECRENVKPSKKSLEKSLQESWEESLFEELGDSQQEERWNIGINIKESRD